MPESKRASLLKDLGFEKTEGGKTSETILAVLARLDCCMYVEFTNPDGVSVTDETGQDWDLYKKWVDLSQYEGFKSFLEINEEMKRQKLN